MKLNCAFSLEKALALAFELSRVLRLSLETPFAVKQNILHKPNWVPKYILSKDSFPFHPTKFLELDVHKYIIMLVWLYP